MGSQRDCLLRKFQLKCRVDFIVYIYYNRSREILDLTGLWYRFDKLICTPFILTKHAGYKNMLLDIEGRLLLKLWDQTGLAMLPCGPF